MPPKDSIQVISYAPDKGAIVQINPQDIPTTFTKNEIYQAEIKIQRCRIVRKYDLVFEFKKETVSPTNTITPCSSLGMIYDLQEGLSKIDNFSISNVSENTLATEL